VVGLCSAAQVGQAAGAGVVSDPVAVVGDVDREDRTRQGDVDRGVVGVCVAGDVGQCLAQHGDRIVTKVGGQAEVEAA
jgi:hypothetical protein